MRKLLLVLLLAGSATPALAAGDRPGRHQESGTQAASESDHSSRQHSDRGNRAGNDSAASQSNGGNAERPHFVARPQSPPVVHVESSGGGTDRGRVVHVETNNGSGQSDAQRGRFRGRLTGGEQPAFQPNGGGEKPADTVRNWRGPKIVEPTHVTADNPNLRQPDRDVPRVFRNRIPIVSNTPREGTQPPVRTEGRRTNWASWSTSHWRNDRKYDWKDWRRKHRSIFHLSFYSDPFGWSYRPYQIGWRLWPSYYSSSFWINDPWQYRLPYAPPGYRWIRYYDDALLVDTWNGQVVDVVYNFFW